jgi:predicted naringenin-chalcone synthase
MKRGMYLQKKNLKICVHVIKAHHSRALAIAVGLSRSTDVCSADPEMLSILLSMNMCTSTSTRL